MNDAADALLAYLLTKHARVYRNAPPTDFIYPFVVFTMTGNVDTYPSTDIQYQVVVYDSMTEKSRAIEDLADSIDNGLNHKVINNEKVNMHFWKENADFNVSTELANSQYKGMMYTARTYFK